MRLLFFTLFAMVAACSTQEHYSEAEISRMQNHRFEKAAYEKVFNTITATLTQEGYAIKTADLKGGYVQATINGNDQLSKLNSTVNSFLNAGKNYPVSRNYELSISLEQNGDAVETKTNLNKIEEYSMGGAHNEVVLSSSFYKDFYEKIKRSLAD